MEEAGRLEFKSYDMPRRLDDFHAYFLAWLALLLDEGLKGRACNQARVYGLGAVSRFGLKAEAIQEYAAEVLQPPPKCSRLGDSIPRRSLPSAGAWKPVVSQPMTSSISTAGIRPSRRCSVSSPGRQPPS